MPNSIVNKRLFPRLPLAAPLRYQIRGTPHYNSTLSNNVSLGGVCFVNNDYLALNTNLALEISVLSQIVRPIGRIRWSAPIPHSDSYMTGVEFVEFNYKEKKYLSDYLQMRKQ